MWCCLLVFFKVFCQLFKYVVQLVNFIVIRRLYMCLWNIYKEKCIHTPSSSQLKGERVKIKAAAVASSLCSLVSVIEGGIAQAVPEHPKRENIFSLSTACGDAYLFQVSALFLNKVNILHHCHLTGKSPGARCAEGSKAAMIRKAAYILRGF